MNLGQLSQYGTDSAPHINAATTGVLVATALFLLVKKINGLMNTSIPHLKGAFDITLCAVVITWVVTGQFFKSDQKIPRLALFLFVSPFFTHKVSGWISNHQVSLLTASAHAGLNAVLLYTHHPKLEKNNNFCSPYEIIRYSLSKGAIIGSVALLFHLAS